MPVYDTILFDLDGTLTDPQLGITRSVAYALAKFGITVPDRAALIPFIGPPLHESFARVYGFDRAQAFQAVAYYREYFTDTGLYENAVYPGIPALLADLTAHGRRLVLATSKPTVYATRILEHFHLAHYFTAIAGSNLDGTRTAKADVIAHARSLLATPPTRAVMVGDREHDIIGAQANGLDTIAVLFGYGTLNEITAAQPTQTAATVAELATLLGVQD